MHMPHVRSQYCFGRIFLLQIDLRTRASTVDPALQAYAEELGRESPRVLVQVKPCLRLRLSELKEDPTLSLRGTTSTSKCEPARYAESTSAFSKPCKAVRNGGSQFNREVGTATDLVVLYGKSSEYQYQYQVARTSSQ